MQPRSDASQRCLNFQLKIHPRARMHSYRDCLGNTVHHFDVPGNHRQLMLSAEALVELQPNPVLPDSFGAHAWDALDAMIAGADFMEMLMPSQFAQSSGILERFARELDVPTPGEARERDALALLLHLNTALNAAIAYVPKSTHVDSPIDHALESRQGVCQDFAHILITLVRGVGIPCRYVSGYLFHEAGDETRSADGATHAWVEALLREVGWVGFDPTNNDYADVPPTKGVFKGSVDSQLLVAVSVAPSDSPPPFEPDLGGPEDWSSSVAQEGPDAETIAQQQQQQQQ